MTDITQIKEALEKATPGPWSERTKDLTDPEETYREIKAGRGFFCEDDQHSGFDLTSYISKEDARLIANSPTWLQYLIDEIEKLRMEKEELLEVSKFALEVTDKQLAVEVNDNIRLRTEHTAMREALEWYASYWNHDVQLEDVGVTSMNRDGGKLARSVLSTLSQSKVEENTDEKDL